MIVSGAAKRKPKNFCVGQPDAKFVLDVLVALEAPFSPRMRAGIFGDSAPAAKDKKANKENRPTIFHDPFWLNRLWNMPPELAMNGVRQPRSGSAPRSGLATFKAPINGKPVYRKAAAQDRISPLRLQPAGSELRGRAPQAAQLREK